MNKGVKLLKMIKQLICCQEFQKNYKNSESNFTRNRKLTFEKVFTTILKLIKKSLPIECELLEENLSKIPASKQAFSKARYNIKHEGFKEVANQETKCFYENNHNGKWKGYRVIAADGSTLRLPDSENILKKFDRMKPNGTSGTMPPKARISLFVDIINSFICSARIENCSVGEQTIAKDQLPEVVTQMRGLNQNKMLFIYDRGYPSQEFMNQHKNLSVDFLFRLQRKSYKKIWERVDNGEEDFENEINVKKGQAACRVRVVTLDLSSGIKEVLITSLFNKKKYTITDLSKIYILRWQIEECYKRLKISAELENFSGKNVESVLQEFWSHIAMCNIISAYMFDLQGGWDIDNLPQERLSFSLLFGISRDKLYKVIMNEMSINKFEKYFYRAVPKAKIKVRPGRSYSRGKVDIPKRHHVFRRVC